MTSVKTGGGPPKDQTTEELLAGISGGEAAAGEELYRRMRGQVYALALGTLKNPADAQDVLQDVFVALFTGAAAFRGSGSAQSYILSITLKMSRKRLRERGRKADLEDEDWMPYLEDNSSLEPYHRALLKECLASLDENERQILLLHAVSGLKHREIAKLLGKPLSTVLSKYNRAVKKLQDKFGKGD